MSDPSGGAAASPSELAALTMLAALTFALAVASCVFQVRRLNSKRRRQLGDAGTTKAELDELTRDLRKSQAGLHADVEKELESLKALHVNVSEQLAELKSVVQVLAQAHNRRDHGALESSNGKSRGPAGGGKRNELKIE